MAAELDRFAEVWCVYVAEGVCRQESLGLCADFADGIRGCWALDLSVIDVYTSVVSDYAGSNALSLLGSRDQMMYIVF